MVALARLVILYLVFASIIYVCLSLYARSARKAKLEAEWSAAEHGDKDTFVAEGLETYSGSIRRKLILGVYVVPVVLFGLIVYLNN